MDDAFWDQVRQIERPPTQADWDRTLEGEEKIGGGAWMNCFTGKLAARSQQERDEFARICKAQEAEIRMCIAPPSVVLAWIGPDGRPKEFRFTTAEADTPIEELFPSPSGRITARRRRITSFPMTIFVVAAELAADTWRRRGAAQTSPPSGSNPESENAPDRPGSEAPTHTHTKQPREPRAAGTLTNPETKRVCADYQAHSGPRGALQPPEEPRRHAARPPILHGLGRVRSGREERPQVFRLQTSP